MSARRASRDDAAAGSAAAADAAGEIAGFRRGAPRPLPAHVAVALSDFAQGLAAAEAERRNLSESGATDQAYPEAVETLRAEAAERLRAMPDALARGAVALEGLERLRATLDGVEAYRRTPAVRRPPEPPEIWRRGAARLLDYGATRGDARPGRPILAVPSLLNRAHILDLTRARSFLRGLAARGARPMLLDWGDPGGAPEAPVLEERGFRLADYVAERLEPALEAAVAQVGRPVALMGHCMAGALAVAAAIRRPDLVDRLVLIAAPWDFRAFRQGRASLKSVREAVRAKETLSRLIEAAGAVFGGVPPELLNTFFLLRDPAQTVRKFPTFAPARRNTAKGRLFVAVEDWLNDGVRLATPAARDVFLDWAFENALATGRWRVGDARVALRKVEQPTLLAASKADTVTPLASAEAAESRLTRATRLTPRGGHIGMLVGPRAETDLWDPLAEWLLRPA